MQISPLVQFILKIFLWLPFWYSVWYFSANEVTILIAYLTELILNIVFPGLIYNIEQLGDQFDIVVHISVQASQLPSGMIAELPIPINPLIYSDGLPLGLSLIMASSSITSLKTLLNLTLSVLISLPFQLFGICFEFMKTLFLQVDKALTSHIILYPWQLDSIAIAYQMGSLVFPSLIPVIIWLFLYSDFIGQFVPKSKLH